MKKSTSLGIKIIAVCFCVILLTCSALYIFVYDSNDQFFISPDMINSTFIEYTLEELNLCEKAEEVEYKTNGFKGIINYNCWKSSAEEKDKYFDYLNNRKNYGSSVILHTSFNELYISIPRHMRLLKALGYGWFSNDGNLYAKIYGKDKAKGKPNYRNHYLFILDGGSYILSFDIFCNTRNIEKAFCSSVECIGERMNHS